MLNVKGRGTKFFKLGIYCALVLLCIQSLKRESAQRLRVVLYKDSQDMIYLLSLLGKNIGIKAMNFIKYEF